MSRTGGRLRIYRPLIERMTGEADADMVGWSYWAYEDCCNSPGAIVADGSQPPQAQNNLRRPLLDALVRQVQDSIMHELGIEKLSSRPAKSTAPQNRK